MPYKTWATNDVVSAADLNAMTADPVTADVLTNENSTATSYGDLTTVGPAVTLTLVSGQRVLITIYSYQARTSVAIGWMSYEITGASGTIVATDANAAKTGGVVNLATGVSKTSVFAATATGSHTFTSKYKTDGVTIGFADRRIIVKKF
jgi:hypothetical protein